MEDLGRKLEQAAKKDAVVQNDVDPNCDIANNTKKIDKSNLIFAAAVDDAATEAEEPLGSIHDNAHEGNGLLENSVDLTVTTTTADKKHSHEIMDKTDVGMRRSCRPLKPRKSPDVDKPDNSSNNNVSKMNDSDEEDEVTIGVTPLQAARMTLEQREELYKRGKRFEEQGQNDLALKCYLRCLMGLMNRSDFIYVPECLRNTSAIYYRKGEYQKATQFVQAEKMHHESALLHANEREKDIGVMQSLDEIPGKTATEQVDFGSELIIANEYESLAKKLLQRSQPDLALDYAGKAAKLKRQILGKEHPAALKSLDFFTAVYAEAGSTAQNTSAELANVIDKFSCDTVANEEFEKWKKSDGFVSEEFNDWKKTNKAPSTKVKKKGVRFGETRYIEADDPDWLSLMFLKVLLVVFCCVFTIFGLYMYCHNDPSNDICLTLTDHSKHAISHFRSLFRG